MFVLAVRAKIVVASVIQGLILAIKI